VRRQIRLGYDGGKCVAVDDDGKERGPANDMGDTGRSVGPDSPGHSGDGSAQVYGTQLEILLSGQFAIA
jgi:hypothetical protein